MSDDIDLARAAFIGPAYDPYQDLAVRAIVRWVGDEVHVEHGASLPDDAIAAVKLALIPHRRRQINNPVVTLDGRWIVRLDSILAPSNRETESVCECADPECVATVWVSMHRRDPHWIELIGTPCPRVAGHTMTATTLGLELLASLGLKVGDDGMVTPL